jgi:hypothetical protein
LKPARLRILFVALALAAIYGPIVAGAPILSRDDHSLLDPLHQLHSPGEYVAAVRAGRVLDLQPLRDLSFWLDFELSRLVSHDTLHFTNVALWVLIVLVLRAVSRSDAVAAAFALHPVFVGSVAWISARKHLLTCLLILLATHLVEKLERRREALLAWLLYLASLLAQPIAVLWPAWVWLRSRFSRIDRRRKLDLLALACLPLTAAALWANLHYYSRGTKFAAAGGAGISLLSLGRSFFNLIAPARLAAMYDPASPFNLLGLLLLPLFAWVAIRRMGQSAWLWLAYFAFPLAIVTARITNIFVSDTYLLLPGAGLAILLARSGAVEKVSPVAGGAVLVALSLLSVREARAWTSDEALWQHACASEGAPPACARWSGYLPANEALTVALDAEERGQGNAIVEQAFARAVAQQRALSPQQKLQLLLAHPSDDPWHAYYLGSVLGSMGRLGEAEVQLREALRSPGRLAQDLPTVAAEGQWLCLHGSNSGCSGLISQARTQPQWDEARYQRRLRELNASR